MDFNLIIGFIIATVALAFMPGPDNIYVLTESISKGWRQGVGITTGLISGVSIHTILVATGLSLIVFKHEFAYELVKYAGAIYLLYLAYGAYREKAIDVQIDPSKQQEPFWRLFRRGFFMNVLNPKVSIFFIAFLPQFVHKDGWLPMHQMLVLGVIFMVLSFIVFSAVAVVSGASANLIKHPRFWVVTKWIKVIVLITLAVFLVLSKQ
ncbi:MAG: LysE family translocator [Salibacteraceae bacterium]